ncbi:MAG: helix-turn-helix transcriptional regulator [Lachnospiraceae bacterium]|nr:helix-turn-helix transcriptional regulator [Lachnospiraceae bacterium]
MILANKIINLRKKCAWSQEELAEKMNVSRQSISKWESGQSVPDLDKILKLCQIFGVSTDYLLKDEMEEFEVAVDVYEPANVKHVSAEEAHTFMEMKKKSAVRIGIGVVLCILSPTVLFFMLGISTMGHVKETLAVAIGLGALMLMVLVAVVLFIYDCSMMSDYEWVLKEEFTLNYGVSGIVEDRMKKQKPMLVMTRAIGVGLCIVAAMVLVITSILSSKAIAVMAALDVLLLLVAIAVYLFIRWGNECGSYLQLLQRGDYAPDMKKNMEKHELVGGIYWCTATAIYLGISFLTNRWDITWIIWPVVALLYGGIACIINYSERKKAD